MSVDFFSNKAQGYEGISQRVENVDRIANAVIGRVNLRPDMHIMDFGSGTGLLLERVAPLVRAITAIDISRSMNEQLEKKRANLKCELEIVEMDLSETDLDMSFDGIISSMTMHHVQDIQSMIGKFYTMLNEGGFIALADLETEDGSFHTEDTGVFHFGFDRDEFVSFARASGFHKVSTLTANTIHKPHGDFPIFLLTAHK